MTDITQVVDWTLVNQLVKPEHQYLEVEDPPLDQVRMAWPFKNETELKLLSKWFKAENLRIQKKLRARELEAAGEALL